jgi:hypothetical protein
MNTIIEQAWALGIDCAVSCGRDDQETIATLLDRIEEGDAPDSLPWPKSIQYIEVPVKNGLLKHLRDKGRPLGGLWPKWYRPTKRRKKANQNVAAGLHPLGAKLGSKHICGETCASCMWSLQRYDRQRKTYCVLEARKRIVLRHWPGCEHWNEL